MNSDTESEKYTHRLLIEESAWWKKALNVQAPYRRHLRRLNLGFTFEIGCGLGRNLKHLRGNAVGIDHNSHSIKVALSRGFNALTPEDFEKSKWNKTHLFDSFLLSHILEHMAEEKAVDLLNSYIDLLKPGGRVVLITPQECGFRSDPSHIQWLDFKKLRTIAQRAGLHFLKEYSFPLPRFFGRFFRYNEFVSMSRKIN